MALGQPGHPRRGDGKRAIRRLSARGKRLIIPFTTASMPGRPDSVSSRLAGGGRRGRGVRLAIAALFLLAGPGSALPAATPQAEVKKAELSELKGRIDALRDEMAKGEASRADAADQLRDMERAISDASRRLRELAEAQGAAQAELAGFQQQSVQLERQIAAQQAQLARLLHNQYVAGESDALHRFLGGEDPSQPARDAYYLRALSQAKAEWLAGLHNSLREKSRLADAVRAKSEELAQIELKSRGEQAQLLAQQNKRRALLDHLAARLKAQRKEIDSLKRDESRLTQLVQGLSRIVRRAPRPKPAAARPQEVASSKEIPSKKGAEPRQEVPAAPATVPAATPAPEPGPTGVSFASLRGRLHLPLKGELAHRFGSRRSDGVSSWKGLFIRAGNGDVRAVAAGRVVFADWLRGFGNLLILDHGDEYLTVYGNNESLYKEVGDNVKAGDAVAAVGSSGGNAETGLYFELRFQGQPVDPQKWMNLK